MIGTIIILIVVFFVLMELLQYVFMLIGFPLYGLARFLALCITVWIGIDHVKKRNEQESINIKKSEFDDV